MNEELYIKECRDGTKKYAYGEPWIAQALFMDDIEYDIPEAAKAAWEASVG